jgi:hypothetical protein
MGGTSSRHDHLRCGRRCGSLGTAEGVEDVFACTRYAGVLGGDLE